jgi:hypothetical protein
MARVCILQGRHYSSEDRTALLVKWNKFQRFKNRIENFLPRNGDHPVVTIKGAYTERDTASKATNRGHETNVPVYFPEDTVTLYKEYNREYNPSAPVKREQAESIMEILLLDIRYLLGCGYEWNAANEEEEEAADPSASGGLPGASSQAPPAAADSQDADKSRSPSPALNPDDFLK